MPISEAQLSQPVERRFYQIEEVAHILATSQAQVYALVRRGELPAIKMGGRAQWRIEVSKLEEWIARQYETTAEWVAGNPFSG
jgi:excisionase family DNA binding protein